MIEGRTGLLNLLNEECVRPKGSDFAFVQKAIKINNANSSLIAHKTDRLSFGIQHYAGEVMYDAESFVTKNMDTLPTDLQDCAEKCSNSIIQKKISKTGSFREQAGRALSNIVAPTVWTKYKSQLSQLMGNLRNTQSRYIRCIKPNSKKQSALMDHKLVVDQLRCSGVVAGTTISRSVFPNRLPNSVVLARYVNKWDRKNFPSKKTSDMSLQEKRTEDCKALLNSALKEKEAFENGRHTKAFVVGFTKTYFRTGALEMLESGRTRGLDSQATTVQRAARGWIVRHKGTYEDQRKQLEQDQRETAERAAAERKAKEKEARASDCQKAEKECLDQIEELEEALILAESDSALFEARERAEKAKREVEGLKIQCAAEEARGMREHIVKNTEQETKLEEVAKLILMLKRENKKLNKAEETIRRKIIEATNRNETIDENSFCLAESVDLVGEEASEDKQEAQESLLSEVEDAKAINTKMRKEVVKWQDLYMKQAEGRLKYQTSIAAALQAVQETIITNSELVEEIGVTALSAETTAKRIMADLLEMENSLPSLADSDISEAGETDHSS